MVVSGVFVSVVASGEGNDEELESKRFSSLFFRGNLVGYTRRNSTMNW